ncbi:MAG: hypothetical protein SF070_01245 [Gemmatimonadota bacterium]|nr:hypothetical protein [Gemmatimonadota bacterium]
MSLLQWWDGDGRLAPLQAIPVVEQLRLMLLAPFHDKRQYQRRQAALAEGHGAAVTFPRVAGVGHPRLEARVHGFAVKTTDGWTTLPTLTIGLGMAW